MLNKKILKKQNPIWHLADHRNSKPRAWTKMRNPETTESKNGILANQRNSKPNLIFTAPETTIS